MELTAPMLVMIFIFKSLADFKVWYRYLDIKKDYLSTTVGMDKSKGGGLTITRVYGGYFYH